MRRDGAEQRFTRAIDFGYTKSKDEASAACGAEDEVLGDVVRVFRTLRPDVVIMRFPGDGRGGHGQHTASAILAIEAFDAAADPSTLSRTVAGRRCPRGVAGEASALGRRALLRWRTDGRRRLDGRHRAPTVRFSVSRSPRSPRRAAACTRVRGFGAASAQRGARGEPAGAPQGRARRVRPLRRCRHFVAPRRR